MPTKTTTKKTRKPTQRQVMTLAERVARLEEASLNLVLRLTKAESRLTSPEPKEPEPWVPKAGDYVKAKIGGKAIYRIERINGPDDWALWYDGTLYPNSRRVQQYRPATQAEIDAHLKAEAMKKQEAERAAITELQEGDSCYLTPEQYNELRALMEPLYACYVGGNSSDEWVQWEPRNQHAPLQRWTREPHGELRPVVIPFHEFLRRAKGTAARLEAERKAEEAKPIEFGTRVKYGKADNAIWMGVNGHIHEVAFSNGNGTWKTAVCDRSEFTIIPTKP